MNPFVRSAYNYDMNKAGDESGLKCLDATLTQQQFREEVDINTLVERFGLTGEMPQVQSLPSYADYEGIFDYQTAMNAVRAANEQFASLPHKVRSRFENDPRQYVEFFQDPTNLEEAIKLGLAEMKPKDEEEKPKEKQGDTPKTPQE